MRRELLLTLTVACFTGCAVPGSRWDPFISQSSTQTPAAQIAQSPTATNQNQEAGFSFTRMIQMAGFQKPVTPAPSLMPQEIVNLSNVISTVTAKSAELNVNDPPEVTRQKAQAILESLQVWDSTLAASNSTGLITNQMAQSLNGWVGQIRTEAQKLVQYMPNPQTIAAIQQLAGSLNSTFGSINSMLTQGNAAAQAFQGTNRN